MGNHKMLKTAGLNVRYSMYDFIDAVKKHGIIWDREHENFHNRELRDQAWQQIGQQLCQNFEAASPTEKQEIAKTLLKRWKNTRDSYLRVNRLRQSGEEVARASYIYEKELSFLLDVKGEEEPAPKATVKRKQYRLPRTPAKRRGETANYIGSPEYETTRDETNGLAGGGLHTALETQGFATDTSTLAGIKGDATSELNNLTAPAAVATAAAADPDPDQAFFDSIKPHMQRMSSDMKLDFQIEVLKILRHFKPN